MLSNEPKFAPGLFASDRLPDRSYLGGLVLEPVVMDLERWNQKDDHHERSGGGLKADRESRPSEDHESGGDKTEKIGAARKNNRGSLRRMRPAPNVTEAAAQETETQDNSENSFNDDYQASLVHTPHHKSGRAG